MTSSIGHADLAVLAPSAGRPSAMADGSVGPGTAAPTAREHQDRITLSATRPNLPSVWEADRVAVDITTKLDVAGSSGWRVCVCVCLCV